MAGERMRLSTRVTFYSPVEGERTSTGGCKQGLDEEFKAWAAIIYLRGGEAVMASRMKGRRPAVLVLRKRAVLENVKSDWVVNFAGHSYEVRELPKPRADGATMEMMVEATI